MVESAWQVLVGAFTSMLIGYVRTSTLDQKQHLQFDSLTSAGCERIFSDVASGAKADRAGLTEALNFAREGDTIVVWKLDRLGRSLGHLIQTVANLSARKIGFRSLQEAIDTNTSGGKLFFHVFGALSEFERDLIRERTNAGLAAARARGRKGGRPRLMDEKKIQMAKALLKNRETPVADICGTLGVSKATLYRYVPLSVDQTASSHSP